MSRPCTLEPPRAEMAGAATPVAKPVTAYCSTSPPRKSSIRPRLSTCASSRASTPTEAKTESSAPG
eukprot:scaffold18042_cov65-Phaeocystis_antarctica.AAC.5